MIGVEPPPAHQKFFVPVLCVIVAMTTVAVTWYIASKMWYADNFGLTSITWMVSGLIVSSFFGIPAVVLIIFRLIKLFTGRYK